MTELKTFNEFHKDYVGGELGEEESNYDQYAFALRQVVIKQIKEEFNGAPLLRTDAIKWIEHFFTITEEELK